MRTELIYIFTTMEGEGEGWDIVKLASQHRCIDVETMLYRRHVPAGLRPFQGGAFC